VEPVGELGQGQYAQAGGGQLDGQWHAVEHRAQPPGQLRAGIGQLEPRHDQSGAVHEQLDGLRVARATTAYVAG
jgi:hypothetical protein